MNHSLKNHGEAILPAVSKRVHERGFVLISLYMLLGILVIYAVLNITLSLASVRMAHRSQAQMQALYLAEAGIDQAIVQLRKNSSWQTGFNAVPVGSTGDYTVAVEVLPDGRRRLFSSGTTSVSQIRNTQSLNVIVQVAPQPLFRYAAFGDEGVTLNGNAETDSYDSSVAPYDPLTPGIEGDVGTNGIAAGSVALTGTAVVGGAAFVGQGGDPGVAITLTGSSTIVGASDSLDSPEPLPIVKIPENLTNQGSISVTGNSSPSIPGGTYWHTDISITGNGQLNFTGPTVIYLSGTLNVGGNGLGTADSLPPNLQILVAGNGQVLFSGNGDFYGAVYAPESSIRITGTGELYGSAIGNTVTNVGNADIHYDEALRNVTGLSGPATVNVLAWTHQAIIPPDLSP